MTLDTPHDGQQSGDQPARPAQRLNALARYLRAFERGDLEAIANILRAAEDDPALERLILALHMSDETGDATLAQAHAFLTEMQSAQGVQTAHTSAGVAPLPLPPAALNGAHKRASANAQAAQQRTWEEYPMQDTADTTDHTTPEQSTADDAPVATTSAPLRAPSSMASFRAAHPSQRRRVVQPVMQAIAAVLILGALVGSFYALFAMRHGQGSKGGQPGVTSLVSSPTPVTDASQVIVTGTADGAVVALNPATGQIYWRYEVGKHYPVTSISIQQGVAYIASALDFDHTIELFALRLRDGHALWHEQLGYGGGYPNPFQVENGILYMEVGLSMQDIGVMAVRLSDGAKLWHMPYSNFLAVADGIAYIGSQYQDTSGAWPTYAVQGTTGKRLWTYLSHGISNGVVFATGHQGRAYLYDSAVTAQTSELVEVDEQTGTVLRRLSIPSINGLFYGNFAQGANGVLYEIGGTQAYAFSLPDGNRLWSVLLTGAEVNARSIAVINHALYLISYPNDSHLAVTALDAASGKLLWTSDTGPVAQYLTYNTGGVSVGGEFNEDQGITQIGDAVFVAGTPGLITLRASDGSVLRRDLPHDFLLVVAQPTLTSSAIAP